MNRTITSSNIQLSKPITKREREILALIAAHYTNKEIAESLHLALSTVKWYTRQIFNKLTVNNRREAIRRAAALGLLDSESSKAAIPNNIPVPMTPFVGRQMEVDQIIHLITNDDTRLVTLQGVGGNGKTRLAIRAALSLVEAGINQFPSGIWFVSLVTLSSPDAIPHAIAKALGHTFLDREVEPIQQLTDYLRRRRLLMVLDNFEHLISTEGIRLITEINTHAPHVKLLITSRSRLNIYGEQIYHVMGMQTPNAETSLEMDWGNFNAIQLFRQSARRIQPTFEIDGKNLQAVSQICQLVEGMPLAIELAAAWIELLPPTEIAEKIKHGLDFLKTDQAGLPESRKSIRAVFNSSWQLLTEKEQQAFLRLCVVIGSFSHEVAQKITGRSLTTLLGLANKSWLQQADGGRFQLHELMRQFGVETLKAHPVAWQAAKDYHADYYADFVAEQTSIMRTPDQIAGLIAIDEEFDTNIKAAWDWLIPQGRWNSIIRKMIHGVCHYVFITKRSDDIIPWLRTARIMIDKSQMDKNRQLAYVILGSAEGYCVSESEGALRESIRTLLKEIWIIAMKHDLAVEMDYWFVVLAGLVHAKNLDPGAKDRLDEAVVRMEQLDDPWMLGMSLIIQANCWIEFKLDEDKLLEASRIFGNLGIPYELSYTAEMLAEFAFQGRGKSTEFNIYIGQSQQFYKELSALYPKFKYLVYRILKPWRYFPIGEFEKGFAAYREQQDFFEHSGYTGPAWSYSLYWESIFAGRYSTYDHARMTRERCLKVARESGTQTSISWNTFELGEVHRVFGNHSKAMEFYRQAQPGFEKLKDNLGSGYCHRAFGDIAIQNSRYAEALGEYHEYLDYAVEDNHLWSIAHAHGKLSLAYTHLYNLEKSRSELQTAIKQMHNWWSQADLKLDTLLVEVLRLIKQGKFDEAVSLSWFILNHQLSWNETKQQARHLLDEASSQLPPENVESAKKRGNKFAIEDLIKELIDAHAS